MAFVGLHAIPRCLLCSLLCVRLRSPTFGRYLPTFSIVQVLSRQRMANSTPARDNLLRLRYCLDNFGRTRTPMGLEGGGHFSGCRRHYPRMTRSSNRNRAYTPTDTPSNILI